METEGNCKPEDGLLRPTGQAPVSCHLGCITMRDETCYLISDNGSYRPEATLSLRRLADRLGSRVGKTVHPVSLLHSARIPVDQLDGIAAEIFEPFVIKKLEEGVRRFHVTPLFFGPSAAILEYMPQRVEVLRASWPDLEVRISPCLVNPEEAEDERMANILIDHIETVREQRGFKTPSVALVDHGAPRIKVTEVRNHLAGQLRHLLQEGDFPVVTACSMERRDGDEYAFNEPLLERVIGSAGFEKEVIVSMLFASPGRHAGPGGDVAKICEEATGSRPELEWQMTELVAGHDGIIDLLASRFEEGVASEPVSWEGEIPNWEPPK